MKSPIVRLGSKHTLRWAATCLWGATACAGLAAEPDLSSTLANLDIEDLANIEITSVSKRETRLLNSPAAVAVLTAEDVRRTGATSIPEALRAVPGLQVARVNANTWAISSRGFNDQYSNKLLVLVDGRTVYTPTFSGVYWNAEDIVLEDLDRIEVIRGPGAALWGANAVNGVINIITKSARETQGGLVSTTFGTEDQPAVSARYGGQLATNLFYRVYAKYFNREGFEDASGSSMADDWNVARGGMRLDWEASPETLITLQGDYHSGTYDEQVSKTAALPFTNVFLNVAAPNYGGNVLGRFTRRFSEESDLHVQAYYDGYVRDHPWGGGSLFAGPGFAQDDAMTERRNTWDIDAQHRLAFGERHTVVWGAGFRFTADELKSNGSEISFDPAKREDRLFSFFAQDEIALIHDQLWLTGGTKVEHNDFTGYEIQPGGRLLWTPTERQSVWASVARAVRTPSRLEQDVRVNLFAFPLPDGTPVQVSALGNPDLQSEELLAYELGYRIEATPGLSFDIAGFYNDYDLAAAQPTLTGYEYQNGIDVQTHGVEFSSQWRVTDIWRVAGSYSWLHTSRNGDTRTLSNPQQQFQLRSTFNLTHGFELNSAIYYVDQIRSISLSPDPLKIENYVRLDAGLSWAAARNLEVSFWAQNLLDDSHAEFAGYKTTRVAEVPRTFYGKITWRF